MLKKNKSKHTKRFKCECSLFGRDKTVLVFGNYCCWQSDHLPQVVVGVTAFLPAVVVWREREKKKKKKKIQTEMNQCHVQEKQIQTHKKVKMWMLFIWTRQNGVLVFGNYCCWQSDHLPQVVVGVTAFRQAVRLPAVVVRRVKNKILKQWWINASVQEKQIKTH